jgi:hypothetical protein
VQPPEDRASEADINGQEPTKVKLARPTVLSEDTPLNRAREKVETRIATRSQLSLQTLVSTTYAASPLASVNVLEHRHAQTNNGWSHSQGPLGSQVDFRLYLHLLLVCRALSLGCRRGPVVCSIVSHGGTFRSPRQEVDQWNVVLLSHLSTRGVSDSKSRDRVTDIYFSLLFPFTARRRWQARPSHRALKPSFQVLHVKKRTLLRLPAWPGRSSAPSISPARALRAPSGRRDGERPPSPRRKKARGRRLRIEPKVRTVGRSKKARSKRRREHSTSESVRSAPCPTTA